MNGLDNLEARRHVNRLCLAAETPLIESGTAGYLGQVMSTMGANVCGCVRSSAGQAESMQQISPCLLPTKHSQHVLQSCRQHVHPALDSFSA